jgi:nitroreductase
VRPTPLFSYVKGQVTPVDVWDAIRARRNVREYTDQPIEAADLDQILEAGRRAPSGRNWQPWDFVVVTGRTELTELARVWPGGQHVARSAATIALIAPGDDDSYQRARFDLGQVTMVMRALYSAFISGSLKVVTTFSPLVSICCWV